MEALEPAVVGNTSLNRWAGNDIHVGMLRGGGERGGHGEVEIWGWDVGGTCKGCELGVNRGRLSSDIRGFIQLR